MSDDIVKRLTVGAAEWDTAVAYEIKMYGPATTDADGMAARAAMYREAVAKIDALEAALAKAERELACRDALIKDHLGTIMHLRNRVDDEAFRAETAEAALAKAVEALEFYADPIRYQGPNQRRTGPDRYEPAGGLSYLWDVTRDNGAIARAALAATPETESRDD